MNRSILINSLVKNQRLTTYLEIGVKTGGNFSQIQAKRKIGVDPTMGIKLTGISKLKRYARKAVNNRIYMSSKNVVLYQMTSDEFFSSEYVEPIGIAFIDGLHLFDQVIRDYLNVQNHLEPNGVVVLHDCLPASCLSATRERSSKHWNGDVWKAAYWLSERNCQFDLYDFDEGLCVIRNKANTNCESLQLLDEPTEEELNYLRSLTFDDFLSFRSKVVLLSENDI